MPINWVNGGPPAINAANLNALSVKADDATLLGPSTGTDDTANINAVLAASTVVRGTPGQTYLISAPLVVKSGAVLDMTGVTIRLKTASNCNMVNNTAVASVRRILDAVTTAASTTLTSATAAFVSGDVGKAITVQGAGTAGVPLTTTIASVTNGTTAVLAAAAGTSVTGQYAAIGTRDSGITIIGGLWDRQDNGDGTSYNGHTMRFRHVDGLTVRAASFNSTAGKYQVNPGDCTRVLVADLSMPAVSSDGVHLNGPCTQVVIRNILGGTMGDDLVSMTARDSTSAITDCAGDITDVVVDVASFLVSQVGLTASCLKVVAGKTTDGSANYAVRRLAARNLTAPNATGDVAFIGDTSGGVIDDLLLDGVRSLGGASKGCALIHGGSSVDRIRLRDLRPAPGDSYAVTTDTAVNRLSVDGVSWVSNTGTPNVVKVADQTVQRLSVTGVQGTAADGSGVLYVGATGTVQRAVVSNSQLDGFRVVVGASGMALTSIDVVNIDVIGAAYPLGNMYSVTTYKAANVTATGMSGWLWVLGSGAVTVTGASGLSGDNDTWAGNVLPAVRGSNIFTVDPDMLASGEESIDRRHATDNGGLASGNLVLTYFTARKTETINNARTFTAGTAAAGTTLARIGVYRIEANGDHTLVASTANDTTLWNSTFSGFTKALSAAWSKQAGQRYAVGMLFVGTTGPNLRGVFPLLGFEDGIAPRINGNLTGQTDLPASITTAVSSSTGLSVYAAMVP